jgi:hypothetical protein
MLNESLKAWPPSDRGIEIESTSPSLVLNSFT